MQYTKKNMEFLEQYNAFIQEILEKTYNQNKEAIEKAAELLYIADVNNHKIYTFGTGHSHMIGQEIYGRAGGFAKIHPILEGELTLTTHPTKSTYIERSIDYADVLEQVYDVSEGDVVIATSNSGRNKLVVEYISRLKAKGVKIIAITSLNHSKSVESRHPSKKHLFELGDVVLDNFAPAGDACVKIGNDINTGPVSTITGCFLSNCLIGRLIEKLYENEYNPPVLISGNLDGADEKNKKIYSHYFNLKK